jgi:acyl-CoA synthetase (AMP-forming)/AMP-acid ligase II
MESFESQISFSTRDLRIGDLLARNDKLRPNEIALIQDDRIVSWRELASGASRIASGFDRVGLRKGSRVATIVKNDAFAIELLFTLALAGFVGIPINFGLTAEEVAVLLRDSVPDAIIVDADLAARFSEILATTTASIFARGFQELPSGWRDIEDVRALGSSDFASPAHPDDIRTIRYTSGTTAAPKGCLGTHRQILASIGYFLRQVPIPGDGPFLQLLPLFSGAGIWMAFAAAYRGVANVLLPTFEAGAALRLIERHRVAHACGVPTMVRRMCDEMERNRYDLTGFKLFGYTGAPMPAAVIDRAMKLMPCDFYQGFGGGEMGGLISYLLPDDHRAALSNRDQRSRLASAGRVADYATVAVRDLATGAEVSPGEIGEITVRSPSNFAGYHNRAEETAKTLRGEWVFTGDVGYIDDDGFLYVVDRVKDIIVTGGMNVSSAEVEGVLAEHPAVQSAAVIGLKDEEWGELVTGVVTLKMGQVLTEQELIDFARRRLAGYKSPKAIRFVPELPLNSAGKVLKRQLRERLAKDEDNADRADARAPHPVP